MLSVYSTTTVLQHVVPDWRSLKQQTSEEQNATKVLKRNPHLQTDYNYRMPSCKNSLDAAKYGNLFLGI